MDGPVSSLGVLAGFSVIPVIVIDDPAAAVDVAHALAAGGIACAEVTLRTPAALDAIRAMASVSGFTVGAGTVLNRDQLVQARDAGAAFTVHPGFDRDLVESALAFDLGVLPGIATASEAMAALAAGVTVVKFFPADRLGGLDTIRALSAPLPQLGFVPSGGVTAETAVDYLADPAVPAVSGSWMATRAMIAARDYQAITRACSAIATLDRP